MAGMATDQVGTIHDVLYLTVWFLCSAPGAVCGYRRDPVYGVADGYVEHADGRASCEGREA